jgi:uncharacterized repeat protein (TIGR03803 family)
MEGGTVFRITLSGKLTTLNSFNYSEYNSVSGLIQATNGDFYGTTMGGGSNNSVNCDTDDEFGCGTVFKITPGGKLTILHSFCSQLNSNSDCADGNNPIAGLIQASNGDFYGTTTGGGANTNAFYCPMGCGTLFKITPSGKLTTLYSFCSQLNSSGYCADGYYPAAALIPDKARKRRI